MMLRIYNIPRDDKQKGRTEWLSRSWALEKLL